MKRKRSAEDVRLTAQDGLSGDDNLAIDDSILLHEILVSDDIFSTRNSGE